MPSSYKQFLGQDLVRLFQLGGVPTLKGWNRLEGTPRGVDLDRPLRAEVRDPLWMLSRQWQLGEFRGEDAGSPFFARVQLAYCPIDHVAPMGGAPAAIEPNEPLERRVERERAPVTLEARLELGYAWVRLLEGARRAGRLAHDLRPAFLEAFPIALPTRDATSDKIYAHQDSWQLHAAAAGRCIDGLALLERLSAADAFSDVTSDADVRAVLDELAAELTAFAARQLAWAEVGVESAWRPSSLDYAFSCTGPALGGLQLRADDYRGGHLDWYAFDHEAPASDASPPAREQRCFDFIATRLSFNGMPNRRWWEMEDRRVDFGRVEAHTTDLSRLLLLEFALTCGNDWFMVPLDVPVGTLASIEGLAVTNVFGEQQWIPSASALDSEWALFRMAGGTEGVTSPALFIPQTVTHGLYGEAREQVRLLRDEMANCVWGVETRVMGADGKTRDGGLAARERAAYLQQLVSAPVSEGPEVTAPLTYRLATSVPENWIPFLPVRMPSGVGASRSIQLQRGAMLRPSTSIPGGGEPVRPATRLLMPQVGRPYFLHEEEVPREGTEVELSWQRARGPNGRIWVWLGRSRTAGRGEGSSGLAFDSLL